MYKIRVKMDIYIKILRSVGNGKCKWSRWDIYTEHTNYLTLLKKKKKKKKNCVVNCPRGRCSLRLRSSRMA